MAKNEFDITLEEIDIKIKEVNDELLRANDAQLRSILRSEHRDYVDLRNKVVESQTRMDIEARKAAEEAKNSEAELGVKKQEVEDKKKLGFKQLILTGVQVGGTLVTGALALGKTFKFDGEGKMLTSTAGKGIVTKMIGNILPNRKDK